MTQLHRLAQRFPPDLVKKPPKGKYGSYIPHAVINERLLEILGPFNLDLIEVVRGHAPHIVDGQSGEVKYDAREGAIVGVVARLTVEVDGRTVSISEVGTEDNPAMHNDAENLKNAMSDALKRCAMRLGVGLHLWSQNDYRLDKVLDEDARDEPQEAPQEAPPAEKPKPRTISSAKADGLANALTQRGVKKHVEFARMVTGRDDIEALTDLNTKEAGLVYQTADGGDPELEPTPDELDAEAAS